MVLVALRHPTYLRSSILLVITDVVEHLSDRTLRPTFVEGTHHTVVELARPEPSLPPRAPPPATIVSAPKRRTVLTQGPLRLDLFEIRPALATETETEITSVLASAS
jgi:hypothetical protein